MVKIHPSIIGKALEAEIGVEALCKQYNKHRKQTGATPFQRKPVKVNTITRYNNQGKGYQVAPPAPYVKFLIKCVAKKNKVK